MVSMHLLHSLSRRVQLQNLRYFVCVAETGSFSSAANLLHRSQPALSRGVRELEAELGTQLFIRQGPRIALSREGWSLLDHAKDVLADTAALIDQAQMLASGKSAVLRIGGASAAIERVLAPLMSKYRDEWPSVDVALTIDSGTRLLSALEEGELDFAFTRATVSDTLDSVRLFPLHLVAVVPVKHELASASSLDLEELALERLLATPKYFTCRMLFDAACKARNLQPQFTLVNSDRTALIALASIGYGIAVASTLFDVEDRNVKALPIVSNSQPIEIWTGLVWRRQQLPKFMEAFISIAQRRSRSD